VKTHIFERIAALAAFGWALLQCPLVAAVAAVSGAIVLLALAGWMFRQVPRPADPRKALLWDLANTTDN
jgi:membrane associated rhomboid family serine protease